jgi:hypothetical protein
MGNNPKLIGNFWIGLKRLFELGIIPFSVNGWITDLN